VPRVLSISRNPQLLAARNDALAMAGYNVAAPKDTYDAVTQFARSQFDAVIIGCSVEIELRKRLIGSLRNLQPKVPIVYARAAGTEEEPLADVTVDNEEDPVAIIVVLDKLLGRSRKGQP